MENEELRKKFLKRLPKKYHEKFGDIEAEGDLIDDCKYILYCNNGYLFEDGGNNLPIRSISEGIEFIKRKVYKEEEL